MDEFALARIIAEAQRGDAAAHEALVDRYSGRLFGFFYRLLGRRDDAEDLMQEVFLRLVRMIAAYKDDGRFEPWLFRIAANLARDRIRSNRRSPQRVSIDGEEAEDAALSMPAEEDQEGPSRRMEQSEDADRLNAALNALPEWEREVLMLRHFSHMSFKEIAELMGTPLGTALARAHRGLERLKEMLSDNVSPNEYRVPYGNIIKEAS